MSDRALIFIDGNNWFHALRATGVPDLMRLSYAKISQKLVMARSWEGTRYYIGALKQQWNPTDYSNQRRFLTQIENEDRRIHVVRGRLEERPMKNPLADELTEYLLSPAGKALPANLQGDLAKLAHKHLNVTTLKEKAVDVALAVDMYRLAVEDSYDFAYLLSADGDFTPPVEAVCAMGKKVYAVSPEASYSSALAGCCTSYIKLQLDWFYDCYF